MWIVLWGGIAAVVFLWGGVLGQGFGLSAEARLLVNLFGLGAAKTNGSARWDGLVRYFQLKAARGALFSRA